VLQLWDQDVIKWNEVVGDAQIDLYRWFLKAYHEKRAINIFKDVNEAIARKQSSMQPDGSRESSQDAELLPEARSGLPEDATLLVDTKQTQTMTMQHAAEIKGPEKKGHQHVQTAEKDAQYFVKQLKELVGLGEIDESARWVKMTYHDARANRVVARGSLAISIEILPLEETELRPAGHGRSEPNANPYLPPTTGRMTFSYNPLALCSVSAQSIYYRILITRHAGSSGSQARLPGILLPLLHNCTGCDRAWRRILYFILHTTGITWTGAIIITT